MASAAAVNIVISPMDLLPARRFNPRRMTVFDGMLAVAGVAILAAAGMMTGLRVHRFVQKRVPYMAPWSDVFVVVGLVVSLAVGFFPLLG